MTDKQRVDKWIKRHAVGGIVTVEEALSLLQAERRRVVRIIKKCFSDSGYCSLSDILKALAGRAK